MDLPGGTIHANQRKRTLIDETGSKLGEQVAVPPVILQHVTHEAGSRIVLVVGAGTSIESPTNFKTGADYSSEAHRKLVADGVLDDGECTAPEDLSVLAQTVYDKYRSQKELTRRLPKDPWRSATPNMGHRIAAALLIEGSIRHVITLNYDLAFANALSQLGNSTNISLIEGPDEHTNISTHSVIYLHRSVNQDEETWVLRQSAIEAEWDSGWETAIASANLGAPVVLFIGLGSPAKVVTENVARIASRTNSSYYLVDRASETKFAAALGDRLTGTVALFWNEFMGKLAERVVLEHVQRLKESASDLVHDEPELAPQHSTDVTEILADLDLLTLGHIRGTWLLAPHAYSAEGDAASRRHVARILACIDHLAAALGAASSSLDAYGRLVITTELKTTVTLGLAHGRGDRSWSSISAEIRERNMHVAPSHRAVVIAVVGARTTREPLVDDILREDTRDDLIRGPDTMQPVFLDDFTNQPLSALEKAIEEALP